MEKMPITITLRMLQEFNPSNNLWEKLLKSLNKNEADDEPLKFSQIAESNGVLDAIWCLRALQGYKTEKSLLAAEIAESVLHIFESRYPNDKRVRECIQGTRDFIAGKITAEELLELRRAAFAASSAAAADAGYVASASADADAAYASAAASSAAAAAAASDADAADAYAADAYAGYTAALAVAVAVAYDAYAADAYAADAGYVSAASAVRYVERVKQKELIIKYFG